MKKRIQLYRLPGFSVVVVVPIVVVIVVVVPIVVVMVVVVPIVVVIVVVFFGVRMTNFNKRLKTIMSTPKIIKEIQKILNRRLCQHGYDRIFRIS